MYQFLNCFPFDNPIKLIRRIKLMKRRTQKRSYSNVSPELSCKKMKLNKDCDSELINNNELNCQNVKLVSFNNFTNEQSIIERVKETEKLTEICTILEKINNEEIKESINCDQLDDQFINQLNNQLDDQMSARLNDQILHELHFSSSVLNCTNQSSNKHICTLANDCNDEEIKLINQIDTNASVINENFNKLMDAALEINNLKSNDQLKLILDNHNLDETDIKNENVINKSTANQSINQRTNQILNGSLVTNQLIETNKDAKLTVDQLDDKRKANKKVIDTDLRTNKILNGETTWIELNKGSNSALGIGLIERTINDEKLFIIHEIVDKAIAAHDGRLKIGDIILQVNDIQLKNIDCDQAIEHLNCTTGSVKLLIYRELICLNDQNQIKSIEQKTDKIENDDNLKKFNFSTMQENNENIEQKIINGKLYEIIQVELQKKANKGLGLCIVNDDGQSPGPYISEILPNSIAFAEGSLKKGDHIVYVNGEDVSNTSINSTLIMLKCLQGLITLKVARLMPGQVVNLESFNQHQPIEPKKINFKIVNLDPKKKSLEFMSIKRKPINDRVKELMVTKPNDSIQDCSLLNETVCNEWNNETDSSTISRNWIKVDKSKIKINEFANLDEQLINQDCPTIFNLENENKIIEVNGKMLKGSFKNQFEKIKKSTNLIQMIIIN